MHGIAVNGTLNIINVALALPLRASILGVHRLLVSTFARRRTILSGPTPSMAFGSLAATKLIVDIDNCIGDPHAINNAHDSLLFAILDHLHSVNVTLSSPRDVVLVDRNIRGAPPIIRWSTRQTLSSVLQTPSPFAITRMVPTRHGHQRPQLTTRHPAFMDKLRLVQHVRHARIRFSFIATTVRRQQTTAQARAPPNMVAHLALGHRHLLQGGHQHIGRHTIMLTAVRAVTRTSSVQTTHHLRSRVTTRTAANGSIRTKLLLVEYEKLVGDDDS